jgi:hypothetical protein
MKIILNYLKKFFYHGLVSIIIKRNSLHLPMLRIRNISFESVSLDP